MPRVARRAHGPRDAEVRHHGRPPRQHDVFRLDIAVHDPVAVRVRQRARHLRRDAQRVLLGQLLLAREPVAQRFALDVRHDIIEEAGGGTRVVQRQDVGVLQPGRNLDLAQEPLGAEGRRQLRVQDLDRHRPVVLQIVGQEHGGHAAASQLPLHRVAVSEGFAQGVEQVGHGTWRPSLQSLARPRQRRSCPPARRPPSYRPRMTNSPTASPGLWARSWRLVRAPSISQPYGPAFIVIAVAGLADRIAVWRSARHTQADMIELTQRLERLDRFSPSPALRAQIAEMQELTAEVGDEAIQLAVQSTVTLLVMVVVLGGPPPGAFSGPAPPSPAGPGGAAPGPFPPPTHNQSEGPPAGVQATTARPLARDVVRQLGGEATAVIQYDGAAAASVRARLHLSQ